MSNNSFLQIALDDNNKRIHPSYSGQRAICPNCGGTLIAKCGEIYIQHWQHWKERDCDPWQEHETIWHRGWKARFPFEWQEVVIEKSGERHRADVRTDMNIVIEFQNSPISTSDIRIREEFYGDMVWVVNAASFKANIKLTSLVKSRLRNLDDRFSSQRRERERFYEHERKALQDNIKNIDNAIRIAENNLEYQRNRLNRLESDLQKIDTYINEVVFHWGETYLNGISFFTLDHHISNEKQKLKEKKQELNFLEAEISKLKNILQAVEGLEDISIDGKQFKKLPFSDIPIHRPDLVRVVSKNSIGTMFKDVRKVTSKQDILAYQYKQSDFVFAVDCAEVVTNTCTKLSNVYKNIDGVLGSVQTVRERMKTAIDVWFKEEISKCSQATTTFQTELEDLRVKADTYQLRQEVFEKDVTEELYLAEINDNKERNTERSVIMNKYKRQYYYTWAHERTTWHETTQRLIFDFGSGDLFEWVSTDVFKKLPVDDFLNEFI